MIPYKSKYVPHFIGIMFFGFIIMVVIGTYMQDQEYKQFKPVTNQLKIKGEVSRIQYYGNALVTFTDEQKLELPLAVNSKYSDERLSLFITLGDSILKNANSDTIFVHRDNKEYYFIIDETIE